MFNAPRRTNPSLAQSAFLNASSSYADPLNPLAASTPAVGTGYGEVDPWSGLPSPARSETPRRDSDEDAVLPPREGGFTRLPSEQAQATSSDGLSGLIADPPPVYLSLFDQMEKTPAGEVSIASVHRLLSSAKLPAATVEKIVNLTARDQTSLSRTEFLCSLALVAYAQSHSAAETDEISIERLSTSIPNLPLPKLSISATSAFRAPAQSAASPSYLHSSPWDTSPRATQSQKIENGHDEPGDSYMAAAGQAGPSGFGHYHESSAYSTNSGPSADAANPDAEAERGYWKRLERVEVELIKQKEGWFLQKYMVTSDKRNGEPVSRRYSDFVWLLDCLTRRYPFRILPSLPPKKIGPNAIFLEQRRKALRRFINMIVNHPVLREDGALNVFLTEPSFEAWRKRVKVSTEEESASKTLTRAQELNIPADLEEKLGILRDHLPSLLGGYQKLVLLAERGLARLQAANADASRVALSLHTIGEEVPRCCYRTTGGGRGCSLCGGVGRGLGEVAEAWTRVAEEGEKRSAALALSNIEALKGQRDLYLAFRDLFIRHDHLSRDNVEGLKKKVEARLKKVEAVRAAQKPNWEIEVDKLVSVNEQDNSQISALLARRVFVRACMWHELSVVFHSRQAAQATLGWREFAALEMSSGAGHGEVWKALGERLEGMPVE